MVGRGCGSIVRVLGLCPEKHVCQFCPKRDVQHLITVFAVADDKPTAFPEGGISDGAVPSSVELFRQGVEVQEVADHGHFDYLPPSFWDPDFPRGRFGPAVEDGDDQLVAVPFLEVITEELGRPEEHGRVNDLSFICAFRVGVVEFGDRYEKQFIVFAK